MRKHLMITKKIITATTMILFCALVFTVLISKASGESPAFFHYQLKAVLSGSMEPTFMTGSVILIKTGINPSSLDKDQIITFRSQDKIITHRIAGMQIIKGKTLYQTKGDNNDAPDLDYVSPENILGLYTNLTIPYAGYLMNYANSRFGSALLLILPGLLLVISSVRTIFAAFKKLEMKNV
ncbi:signal peptidase I [Metabacillus sp. GX 13764]|uniref:signal peptidase I SipW n=1 Tax=Metabacillus kandeliae TaxID=2900151 RepID=UPI001E42864E|nr:signal peptidase I [Metabacillus kandeliae]MCD7033674.1 signal peptidase I [Metabacillus kandeliae]